MASFIPVQKKTCQQTPPIAKNQVKNGFFMLRARKHRIACTIQRE